MKPRTPHRIAFPLVLALAASGCPDNNGSDPPKNRIFFPIAAALQRSAPGADANFLYVVNANFDLRYNGSTVAALDLRKLRGRLGYSNRGARVNLGEPPRPAPVGCVTDPADTSAVLCDEDPPHPPPADNCDLALVCAGGTRKINPYAVEAALATYERGEEPDVQRLYVLVRGGNTMAWFDVDAMTGRLNCGTIDDRGYCSADHATGGDPAQSRPAGTRLPADPSSLSVDPRRGLIVVTHQSFDEGSPRATLFYDPASLVNPPQNTRPYLVNVVGGLAVGLSSLALLPRASEAPSNRSTWLVTSRSSATFTTLQAYPGDAPMGDGRIFLYRASTAPVTGLNNGADSRALALDPREPTRRAYVVSRRPEALLTLDIRNPAAPVVESAIPLPSGSSRLVAVAEGDRTLVYTVSYDSRRIYVVDPSLYGDNPTSAIVAQIASGRGPHAIIHDPLDKVLYVLDFLDAAVEVIDVAPTYTDGTANRMYNRRIATVGAPGRRPQ